MLFSGIADEAGNDLAVQVKAQKQLGWNRIELRMIQLPGMKEAVNIASVDGGIFDQVRRILDEAELSVSCFASKIGDWSRPVDGDFSIDKADLVTAIPRMRQLGTNFIRVMSWPKDSKNLWSEYQWSQEAIRRMEELVEIAADSGVTLAHENCSGWGGVSAENCQILLTEVDSPAFKVLFDTGNPPTYGQNSFDWYQAVFPHIVYVHIKDAQKVSGKDVYTWPGEGDGCVRKIVADLATHGYNGVYSIEPHLEAVIHTGQEVSSAEKAYQTYVEYGQRFQRLYGEVVPAEL